GASRRTDASCRTRPPSEMGSKCETDRAAMGLHRCGELLERDDVVGRALPDCWLYVKGLQLRTWRGKVHLDAAKRSRKPRPRPRKGVSEYGGRNVHPAES